MSLVGQAYDEPGSWGRLSEGWPETPHTPGKWLLCTKAEIVPYGSYVAIQPNYPSDVGAVIRVATEALKKKLEEVHREMFVICRTHIVEELIGETRNSGNPQAAYMACRIIDQLEEWKLRS